MFDTNDVQIKDSQLIEIRYSKKFGKPTEDGRQMYQHHIEFVSNEQRYDHDVYDFTERKEGFYLPSFKPKTVYIQQMNEKKEKYIIRKSIVILQIGAFVHA